MAVESGEYPEEVLEEVRAYHRKAQFKWDFVFVENSTGFHNPELTHKTLDEAREYAEYLLKTYGLFEFRDKYPSQLSGGMRQRVALIRTLVTNPQILLLDEAFSALDYQTRLAVNDDIYAIIKKENKTAIMVTHDIAESISMADRVIVLTRRPGTIKSCHPIELKLDNRTPLSSRKVPEFQTYFDRIWKELDVHV